MTTSTQGCWSMCQPARLCGHHRHRQMDRLLHFPGPLYEMCIMNSILFLSSSLQESSLQWDATQGKQHSPHCPHSRAPRPAAAQELPDQLQPPPKPQPGAAGAIRDSFLPHPPEPITPTPHSPHAVQESGPELHTGRHHRKASQVWWYTHTVF